ncbi:MAG: hypothetical protein LKI94_01595 [Sporolactobacillus sp.]|jgi:hypothetical protein|nr:hypothetical protein [Sporolactobacillus sp.]
MSEQKERCGALFLLENVPSAGIKQLSAELSVASAGIKQLSAELSVASAGINATSAELTAIRSRSELSVF